MLLKWSFNVASLFYLHVKKHFPFSANRANFVFREFHARTNANFWHRILYACIFFYIMLCKMYFSFCFSHRSSLFHLYYLKHVDNCERTPLIAIQRSYWNIKPRALHKTTKLRKIKHIYFYLKQKKNTCFSIHRKYARYLRSSKIKARFPFWVIVSVRNV